MRSPMRRALRRVLHGGDDAGYSVAEVMVTSAVLATALAIVFSVLVQGQTVVSRQQVRSETIDQAHLAMAQIGRDVRSGNVIASPGPVGGTAGMEVRVYTQTRGQPLCVQYQVAGEQLQRRTRPPGVVNAALWPTTWEVVASGVVNAAEQPAVPAFSRSFDKQTLNVALVMNKAERSEGRVRLDHVITGRNTKFYDTPFADDQCT